MIWVVDWSRRLCPGRFLAESSLWLTMASVLAAFDIKPPVDENGREVIPPASFTSGTARLVKLVSRFVDSSCSFLHIRFSQPQKFRCRITPRTEKYVYLIGQEETFD